MGEIYLGENYVFTAAMGGAILKKKKIEWILKFLIMKKKHKKFEIFKFLIKKEKRLEMA